jgi:hypothetical protein
MEGIGNGLLKGPVPAFALSTRETHDNPQSERRHEYEDDDCNIPMIGIIVHH